MDTPEQAVIRQWFEEVWHQGNEDALYRLFAEQGKAHGLEDGEGRTLVGPGAYAPFLRLYRTAFPDIRFEIEDMIQEGERVAIRCRVSGTHTGEGLGIAPTHRPISIAGMTFGRVSGGQIQEAWNVFDFRSLMGQVTGEVPDGQAYDVEGEEERPTG